MKTKFLMLIALFIVFSSFKNNEAKQNQVTKSQNLNISFLLDLSDRIDPKKNPGYYQRDIQYIRSVQKAFTSHVKQKRIIRLDDQMQVFFEPQPNNGILNDLSAKLKVNFTKNSSKKDIEDVEKTFSLVPQKFYQSAINDGKYIGSDIFRFFKNKVKNYCVKENHRNILVILTDGYMYHQNSILVDKNKSSYITPTFIKSKKLTSANYKSLITKNEMGFIPATKGLENLEVIIVGINPSKNNPYEEDVINQYWSDWFKGMGIKKFSLNLSDLPSDIDPLIQKFILGT